MSRQTDLESDIRKVYKILREYEELGLPSDRPDERERVKTNVRRYSDDIRSKLIMYQEFLEVNPGTEIPDDILGHARAFLVPLPNTFSANSRSTNDVIVSSSSTSSTTSSTETTLATFGCIAWFVLGLILGWVVYDKFNTSWWSAFLCWGPGISFIFAAGFMALAGVGQQSRK